MMLTVYHLNRDLGQGSEFAREAPFLVAEHLANAAAVKWRAGCYRLVADILGVDDLADGWRLTNTIDRPWWQNAEVTPRFKPGPEVGGRCRSSMVGDVIMNDDGELFVVCGVGFRPLPMPGSGS
jgi:hypothetical protein